MIRRKSIKDLILEAVREGNGTPIYQIAKECSISVATVSKYCYVLEAEKKIKIQSFGNMKLVSRR